MACCNIAALLFALFAHAHANYVGPRLLDGSPVPANDWKVKSYFGELKIYGKVPDWPTWQKSEFKIRNVQNPHSLASALETKFPGAKARARFRGGREGVKVAGVEIDDLKKFLLDSGNVIGLKERTPKNVPGGGKEEEAEEAAEAEVVPELLTVASPEDIISKLAAGLIGFCVGSGIVYAVFRFRQSISSTKGEALLAA